MKNRIVHLVSADADLPLLRSVAALHLAERQLGADSILLTSSPVSGAGHQRLLPVPGRSFTERLSLGRLPGWLRRHLARPADAVTDTRPDLVQESGLTERVAALRPEVVHLHAVRSEIGSMAELAALPGKLCWSVYDRFWSDRAAADVWMKRTFQWYAAAPFLADELAAVPLFQGRECDILLPVIAPGTFHPDPERRRRFRRSLGAGDALVVMMDGRGLTPFFAEVLAEVQNKVKLLLLTFHQPEIPLSCPVRVITDDGSFSTRIADAYRAADCWLAAEETQADTLPLALLEAAACGTPALAGEGSPAAAFIAPEWSGLRIREKNAAAWVNAMLALRADREGYGGSASEQVFTSYSPLNAARRLLEKY